MLQFMGSHRVEHDLTTQQQPFSPLPLSMLLIFWLFDNSRSDMKWYIIVVLIYISLMINNIEHLFLYVLAICLPLKNVYSGSLPICKWSSLVVIIVCYWVIWVCFICWLLTYYQIFERFENISGHSYIVFSFCCFLCHVKVL